MDAAGPVGVLSIAMSVSACLLVCTIGSIDSLLSSSITPHSFIPGLKPSFSANPSHRSPPFSFPGLTPRIPWTVYVSSAVRRIAKCGLRNLRPSCDYIFTIAVVSSLFTGATLVDIIRNAAARVPMRSLNSKLSASSNAAFRWHYRSILFCIILFCRMTNL